MTSTPSDRRCGNGLGWSSERAAAVAGSAPGTAATRAAVVPADEPAVAPLPDLTGWLGRSGSVVTSPAGRCWVRGCAVDARLGSWDLGEWTGRPLRDVDLLDWRTDPAFAGHGGESLLALSERVRLLLADWHGRSGRLAVVTHARGSNRRSCRPCALPSRPSGTST